MALHLPAKPILGDRNPRKYNSSTTGATTAQKPQALHRSRQARFSKNSLQTAVERGKPREDIILHEYIDSGFNTVKIIPIITIRVIGTHQNIVLQELNYCNAQYFAEIVSHFLFSLNIVNNLIQSAPTRILGKFNNAIMDGYPNDEKDSAKHNNKYRLMNHWKKVKKQ